MGDRDLWLFIDFGSTFTKVVAVDPATETIRARVQAPTTVATDITEGLGAALRALEREVGTGATYARKLACSSAAGGLRMVTVGLVPELTSEAARLAALGAGAKVVGTFSYKLPASDLARIKDLGPDLILLAGGTDGGNEEVILHNARGLAELDLAAPLIVAGNRVVADEAAAILRAGGKEPVVADNVMPEFGRLSVEPVRERIREIFISHIVKAKGLQAAERFVEGIVMPTPNAVLNAAVLLADGCPGEPGLGELVVLDVGGATTDVHSVARGAPTDAGVVVKGLQEPYAKRTVEGDLGVRYNLWNVVEAMGGAPHAFRAIAERFARDVATTPQTAEEAAVDAALATVAVGQAMRRHAGSVEVFYSAQGPISVVRGKDLRGVSVILGTGGPLVFSPRREAILRQACYDPAEQASLRPVDPRLYIDSAYTMFAFGLLGELDAKLAVRMLKRYCRPMDEGTGHGR
ncbi:MAG: glutamate mutase L [Candidatus Rokubacteria bacterium]|nr:glutamate mutase L [Candidatus Rokubacteria bacterium]